LCEDGSEANHSGYKAAHPDPTLAYFRFIILKNVTVVFSSGPTGAGTA
jgi:hypothetical protein